MDYTVAEADVYLDIISLCPLNKQINDMLLQTHEESHAGASIYTADVSAIDADTAVVTFHVDYVLTPGNGDQR